MRLLKSWSVPPSSTSASHHHRVPALEQRVEELHHRDGDAVAVAAGEVVALEHPGDGGAGGEAQDVLDAHRAEPLGVAADLERLVEEDAAGPAPRRWRRSSSTSSFERRGRVADLPDGSPTWAVKSPMIRTAVCPSSWNWRSLRSTTAKPRWMSDAVGSMPSLTRSERPVPSLRAEVGLGDEVDRAGARAMRSCSSTETASGPAHDDRNADLG